MMRGNGTKDKWDNPMFVEDVFAYDTYRYNENEPKMPGIINY
jgi:hypothetical protein